MTNLSRLQGDRWKLYNKVTCPDRRTFIVQTVQYKRDKYEILIFRSSKQGDVYDYRSVYGYQCSSRNEALYRTDVICLLLRRGKYIMLDKYDLYFN
ncbi:hypothetical protein [uncultured Eubacterium sp.]|uniref:hypothetical protein n=1 Tax=uncultured Eubacterium sp. TaxID=165185 RepID=UPI00262F09B8|nr:hypothetical protein [uncultured Eubacterium sp.]